MIRLVMTGGPSAGKTTIAQALQSEFQNKIQVVPEAASMLFSSGFPRANDPASVKEAQLAIYHTQKQIESFYSRRNPKKLILCDRGSLDGAAYWPGSPNSFFRAVRSNGGREMKRYDWVLHLNTANASYYELNSVRTESVAEAHRLDEKVRRAWKMHPRVFVIPHQDLFIKKIEHALILVRGIMKDLSHKELLSLHSKFLEETRKILDYLGNAKRFKNKFERRSK